MMFRRKNGGRPDIDRMFRLQIDDALEKYTSMEPDLQAGCDTVMSFDYTNEDSGSYGGHTVDHHDGTASVLISCREIREPVQGLFPIRSQMFVPGRVVVRNVIAAWHEREHAIQFAEARKPDGDPYLAMRLLCDRKNPVLYNDLYHLQNYWHNRTELASERSGVINSPKALHKMFPGLSERDCELAVLDYIDSRCFLSKDGKHVAQANYFVGFPLKWDMMESSVSEVDGAFKQAIATGKLFVPSYQLTIQRLWTNELFRRDDFGKTVDYIDKRSPWSRAYDRLAGASDEQDAVTVLASIALLNDPAGWKEYPCLEKARHELDPDVVFGSGFMDIVTKYDTDRKANTPYLRKDESAKIRASRPLPSGCDGQVSCSCTDPEFGG